MAERECLRQGTARVMIEAFAVVVVVCVAVLLSSGGGDDGDDWWGFA